MLYKPGPLKNSFVRRSDAGESRDLRAVCDNLEKELDRKENRNDNLSRELSSLRASYANQQREQRIVSSTFEKLNSERSSLYNEANKSKECIAKMEIQLARLSDSQLLLDHVGRQQHAIDTLQGKLDKSQGSVALKDDIIKSLEKELDTLHRAFDVQDRYESPRSSVNTSTSAIQVDREKMRSLYYELGKRQSDAHSLTLTLADSSIEMGQLKQNAKDLLALKAQMEENGINQRIQYEELLTEKNGLLQELSINQEKSHKIKDLNSKMTGQVEDLSKRLSELRSASDAIITEKETLIFELSSLLYTSQLEVVSLNGRVDEMKQSVSLLQSATELTEQRSTVNLNKAIAERQVLAELLHEAESLKPELSMVHQHLEEALQEHEEKNRELLEVRHSSEKGILQARRIAEELQRELFETQKQLESVQNRESDLEDEKTHALSTLQRTLEAAKSLTLKLQVEKDRRMDAEDRASKAVRLADTLQRAKEHVSSAVLDALHLEKSKSVRLENVLQQMTSSRDFIPFPRPGSTSASPARVAVSEGEYYEGKRQVGTRFDPPSSSSMSQSYSGVPTSPPRNFNRESSSTSNTTAVIAEYQKNVPPYSQSSPSRMLSAHSQNIVNKSRDVQRESWRLMERAVDSGVHIKSTQDDRLRESKDGMRESKDSRNSRDITSKQPLENSELRLSAPKVLASPSRSVSMVDGLTRLRDHLREIEGGFPSPLNQSRSILQSTPNSTPYSAPYSAPYTAPHSDLNSNLNSTLNFGSNSGSKPDNNHRYERKPPSGRSSGGSSEGGGSGGDSTNGEVDSDDAPRVHGQQTHSVVHGQQTQQDYSHRGHPPSSPPPIPISSGQPGVSAFVQRNVRRPSDASDQDTDNRHHFSNGSRGHQIDLNNLNNNYSLNSHNDYRYDVSDEEISLFDLAK